MLELFALSRSGEYIPARLVINLSRSSSPTRRQFGPKNGATPSALPMEYGMTLPFCCGLLR